MTLSTTLEAIKIDAILQEFKSKTLMALKHLEVRISKPFIPMGPCTKH
jgi:hypothetical protein